MEDLHLTIRSHYTRTFKLNRSFSYIKIKRLVITSLLGREDWLSQLNSIDLIFNYYQTSGETKTKPMNLMSKISIYQKQPIIDFDNLLVPEENVKNINSFGSFYNELKISIESNNPNNSNIEIEMFYESSPGAVLTDN